MSAPSWTVGQLVEATGGRLLTGDPQTGITGVCLDSRRVQPHEAFLAICGVRHDAHKFIPEVLQRGATCLIVSQVPSPLPPIPTMVVDDTTQALGRLAAAHRRRFSIPVIAVTGSCGKTTTKELIAHLLGHSRAVLKTQGTQNNHIGLPLTLLQVTASHEAVVVELGSNHPGEIAALAQIARPTVAVITNVGPAHLEFFGSLDVVRQEKLSLLDALEPSGVAVVPGDQLDVLLAAKARLQARAGSSDSARGAVALLTFGISDQCGVQAVELHREGAESWIRVRGVAGTYRVPLPGLHNVENALAALACVKALGIPLESLRDQLASFSSLPLRSELIECDGLTIVNDCYNANPLSFARGLDILQHLDVRRRVAIAGDMLELGASAPAAHRAIGRLCVQAGVDVLIAVGEFAQEVARGASEDHPPTLRVFDTVEALLARVDTMIQHGDGVLIKGSRKLALDRVTRRLWECHHVSRDATAAAGAVVG